MGLNDKILERIEEETRQSLHSPDAFLLLMRALTAEARVKELELRIAFLEAKLAVAGL